MKLRKGVGWENRGLYLGYPSRSQELRHTTFESRPSETLFQDHLKPSAFHIGRGVASSAQAAAPVYSRVYKRPTLSDRLNDTHLSRDTSHTLKGCGGSQGVGA